MAIGEAACAVMAGKPAVLTSLAWLDYFAANAERCRPIPWDLGAGVTPEELDAIARSLQAWQLGETSDGRHLRAAAARFAEQSGDPAFTSVIDLFIGEEQRHGELLGRFLDLAGVGRVASNWGDSLFRRARYFITSMEAWTTPVVMVEALATIYYNAIRCATKSPVLRAVCAQILADEGPHLRLQCERLAGIFRGRSRFRAWLTHVGQRVLFLVVVLLVWIGHRRALRAGGYPWRRFWRSSWNRMKDAWKRMNPARYAWPQDRSE